MLRDDPEIAAIRAVRHRISQQHKHDPKLLIEYYLKLQGAYRDRVLPESESAHDRAEAVAYPIPDMTEHALAETKSDPYAGVKVQTDTTAASSEAVATSSA